MAISLRVSISGARETLAAFRQLPKDATKELRDASLRISQIEANKIRSAALASSSQSAIVAPGIRAARDRFPSVVVGGRKRAGRQTRRSKGQKPTTVSDLMLGANFGATHLRQFRSHRGAGTDDYWFFSTAEKDVPRMVDQWGRAVDKVLRRWGNG